MDTQGDAFFVAFRRAKEAVAAAVDAQRALAEYAWPEGVAVKVRMGIHTGEPSLGEEGYHGLGLHRGARICAAGHGGQILVSSATRELIEDELPEDVELQDLGEQRLKDLPRPERIFQVSYPGAPASFPALKTLDAQPADAPFGGREQELAAAVATRFRWTRRRRGLAVVGAAAVLAIGLAVAALVIGNGSASAGRGPANAVGIFSFGGTKLAAERPVGTSPSGIAVGEGGVWVTNTDSQTVSRIDPTDRSVVQTIDVGSGPAGIAVGGGFVWVANSLDGTVSQIDPARTAAPSSSRIKVGNEPTASPTAGARLGDQLRRQDPDPDRPATVEGRDARPDGVGSRRGRRGSRGRVGHERGRRTVTRDRPPSGRRSSPSASGTVRRRSRWGPGAVWVANALDGTVSEIDPRRASVVTTIGVGAEPRGVAVGHGKVWVSSESGTLIQIDPGKGTVARAVKIGNRPEGLALGPSGIYVAVRTSGLAHRGGTLRVVGIAGPRSTRSIRRLDYSNITFAVYDGLVGFRRVGGAAGGQLVPNLAEALPTPSADRKTYAFRVRPGIRYSTGSALRASDFRWAIERTFAILGAPGPGLYFDGIVGARPARSGQRRVTSPGESWPTTPAGRSPSI